MDNDSIFPIFLLLSLPTFRHSSIIRGKLFPFHLEPSPDVFTSRWFSDISGPDAHALYSLLRGHRHQTGFQKSQHILWPWCIVDVSNLIELCELCKCSREANLMKASAIDMVLCWWRFWLVEKVWNAIVGSLLPVLLLFSWSVLVHFHYLIHFERPWNIPGCTQCKTPVDRWHKVVCGKKVLVSVVRPRAFGWWAHKGHCGHLWAYSRADVVSPTIPEDKYWLTTTAVSVVQKSGQLLNA